MRSLVGEPDHLVLDRGAIARAASGQVTTIDGAFAQIGGDDAVGLFSRGGDATGDLGHVDAFGQKAERHRLGVGRLHFEPVPGDGPTVEAGWRSGLQAPHRQPGPVQIGGHASGRGLAVTARRDALIATMDDAVQEGAGRQDHSCGMEFEPLCRRHADHAVAVHDQALCSAGHQRQVRGLSEFGLHGLAVKPAVDLAARTPYGGALGSVEQPELDAGHIGQSTHEAVQGVDLPNEMALA